MIADEAYKAHTETEDGTRPVVGVNRFTSDEPPRDLATYELDIEGRDRQLRRLAKVKQDRDQNTVNSTLTKLSQSAEGTDNLMPRLIDCVNAYCTVGEMVAALKSVWGEFQQPAVYLDGQSLVTTRPRVLIAKPGLDGHDRGAKIIARALRDAGFEVIYTGIRQRVEAIVATAVQEDVSLIGLSILSGAHLALTTRVIDGLKAADAADIPVVVGGTIPASDVPKLLQAGATAVFPTGTPLDVIVGELEAQCASA
jgi:methylmalonyl-CoA mutase C-terminal domain/subunit